MKHTANMNNRFVSSVGSSTRLLTWGSWVRVPYVATAAADSCYDTSSLLVQRYGFSTVHRETRVQLPKRERSFRLSIGRSGFETRGGSMASAVLRIPSLLVQRYGYSTVHREARVQLLERERTHYCIHEQQVNTSVFVQRLGFLIVDQGIRVQVPGRESRCPCSLQV
jgi:hypothetical protein